MKIEIVNDGVVYRNANPGYDYRFASHPHAVQLSGGELLCVYQRGQAMYVTDLELVQTRSIDGGQTWRSGHKPA